MSNFLGAIPGADISDTDVKTKYESNPNTNAFTDFDKELSAIDSSTGLISGGVISVNGGDNTLIDITAGRGVIIDSTTDPDNPTKTEVVWTAKTGVDLTMTADPGDTVAIFLALDINGDIIERSDLATNEQRRDSIDLGLVARIDTDQILFAVNTSTNIVHNPVSQLHDFFESWGAFNIEGNAFTAFSTNLQIQKSQGKTFRSGANFRNNPKDPHVTTVAAVSPATFNYKKQDGVDVDPAATAIDPNQYDNGGTLTAVASNDWSVQRIAMFAEGAIEILYGQKTFDTKGEAIAALSTISFVVPADSDASIPMAYLVVKQGATDLSLDTQAEFFSLTNVLGISSVTGSTATLQSAYDNGNKIFVNGVAPSRIELQGATGLDTDTILAILNNAGSDTVNILANGNFGLGIASPTSKIHLPLENDAVTPTISFGDGDTGFYEQSDDNLYLANAGVARSRFTSTEIESTTTNGGRMSLSASTSASPAFTFNGDNDTGIGRAGANQLSLITAGSERARVLANGNIGIGTAVPNTRLEVASTSNTRLTVHETSALATNDLAQVLLVNGTTFFGANDRSYQLVNEATSSTAADFKIQYWNGSTTLYPFKANSLGKVGIGSYNTEQPQDDLHIRSTTGTALRINNTTSGSYWRMSARDNGDLDFGKNGANNNLNLNSNGNVGIGVATADGKLNVVDANFPVIKADRTSTTTNAQRFSAKIIHTTTADMVDGFGSGIGFYIEDSAAVENSIAGIAAIRDGADNEGQLLLQAGTNGAENHVRIKANGNVGIGSDLSDPGTARLNVYSSGTTSGTYGLYIQNSAGAYFSARDDGNIGIGTVSPDTQFHIVGDGSLDARVTLDNTATGGDRWDIGSVVSAATGIPDGSLMFWNNDTATISMVHSSAGYVGIGTSNPTNALEVAGTVGADSQIAVRRNSDDSGSTFFVSRKSRGSEGSETAVNSGDQILSINAQGHDGTTFANGAKIVASTTQNWTGASKGTKLEFVVTQNGTTTNFTALEIDNNGNVGIGATAGTKLYVKDSAQQVVSTVESGVAGVFTRYIDSTNSGVYVGNNAGTLSLQTSGTDTVTIDDDRTIIKNRLNFGAGSELTISSGAVTVTASYHYIDTESDASSDNLDNINGGTEGDILIIRSTNIARDVVVRDNSVSGGNIYLNDLTDFTLTAPGDKLVLFYDGANYTEIARSNNE